MAAMIRELYTALLAAGPPEDKAGRAASSVLESESRFTDRVSGVEMGLGEKISSLDFLLTRLEWMVGLLVTVARAAVPLIVKA
jgi:hypothetical protein